jgi:hypothetical protein
MAIMEELLSLNGIGMLLIITSWAVQIARMLRGKKEIAAEFALLQVLGIVLIAAGLWQGSAVVSALNIASAVGASCVLALLLKK